MLENHILCTPCFMAENTKTSEKWTGFVEICSSHLQHKMKEWNTAVEAFRGERGEGGISHAIGK